jgi:5-methylcytosine-specific restriction protein A
MPGDRAPWNHGGKSRQDRGYGAAWDRLRKQILERDKYLCQVCLKDHGRVRPAREVDHALGKAKGGTDDPSNLRAICVPCHRDKSLREQGKTPRHGCDETGWPRDPNHPWNRARGGRPK